MKIAEYIAGRGYKLIDASYYKHIGVWEAWYRGKVDSFHKYTIYNKGKRLRRERASLNMAKQGCEYWSNLLWNNECYISLDDENADKIVNETLKANDFWRQTNQLTEKAFALGTGAYITYQTPSGVKIDYVQAPYIYPLAWDNDTVESCAFVSAYTSGKKRLVYVMFHERLPSGKYLITNKYFQMQGESEQITPVPAPDKVKEAYTSDVPLFALVTPNIANNISPVPMGISVYANCIDTLKSIDLAYDGAKVAMEIGRPRVGVTSNGFRVDVTEDGGEMYSTFEADDIAVYDMGQGGSDEKVTVEDLTTTYRADSFEASLQAQLNIYSQAIGLGDKAFKWEQDSIATATQVVSENSAMLRSMEKHHEGLRSAITQLIRAILSLSGLSPDIAVTITFDDSVTRDRNAERQRFWGFVLAGKFSFWQYLVDFEGYSEADAKKIEAEAQSNAPKLFEE